MLRAAIAWRLTVLAVLVGGTGLVGLCRAESPVWPSWRGGERHGNLPDGEYPTQWNAASKQGILWRTAIPGHGYSSPVVDSHNVYVTTASVAEYISPGRLANHWLLLAAAGTCGVFGVSLAIKSARPDVDATGPDGRRWLRALAMLIIVAAAILFMLFGESFGERGTARTRGWIAHVAAAFLCVAMGGALLAPGSVLRRASATMLLILTAVVIAFLVYATQSPAIAPRQPDAPQFGVPADLTKKMVWIVFAGVVAIAAGGWILAGRLVARPAGSGVSTVGKWRQPALAMFAVLSLMGGVALLALVVKRLAVPDAEMEPISLQTSYSKITLAVIAAATFSAAIVEGATRWLSPSAARIGLWAALTAGGILLFVQFNWTPAQQRATRSIVSVDRETGAIRWQCDGLQETVTHVRSRRALATPTPTVSDQHVVGYFGNAGLVCADKQGQVVWTRHDVPYNSLYGVASSPLLIDDTVVVMSDGPAEFSADGEGHLWAFDVRTGEPKWRVDWPAEKSFSGNSRTPCALAHSRGTTILVWGWGWLQGVDLVSGVEVWKLDVPQPIIDQVASAILDEERLVLTDQNGTRVWSRAALERGEVEELWADRRAKANCPSPCLVAGQLYTVTDGGVASCLDAQTGRVLWRQRLEGEYYASVTGTSQHVYFTNTAGLTTVVRTGRRFEKVAESPTGQETRASIAAFDNRFLLRGERELICIGKP